MDGVALASTIFGGFSALSDAIGLYRKFRDAGFEPPTAGEIEQSMQAAEAAAKTATEPAKRLKDVIDDEDLEVIRVNVDREKDRLRKSLGDPANDNQAKDKAIDVANSSICAELNRIKRLNGGKLPGKEYDRWWASHGCV